MSRLLRFQLVVVGLAVFMATRGHIVLKASMYDDCSQVCGSTTDCSTACTSYGDEPFDETCGDYNGGASNQECDGGCGDAYCNHATGEDDSNGGNYCEADCGGSPECVPDWRPNGTPYGEADLGASEELFEDSVPFSERLGQYDCDLLVNSTVTIHDRNNCEGSEDYLVCGEGRVENSYLVDVFQHSCNLELGPYFDYGINQDGWICPYDEQQWGFSYYFPF